MCGIIGYIGKQEAAEVLLDGLLRLEYRGYDSSGLAILNGQGITVQKAHGKLQRLVDRLQKDQLFGTVGIGHTRWATHGVPNEINAHPHTDCKTEIAVVHNGIIENFREIKKSLEGSGHRFHSETDTEVLPHLIESLYRGDLFQAVQQALHRVHGSYAVAVICANEPNRLVAARKGNPLVLGIGKNEFLVASDVPAVLKHTHEIVYLEDGEIVDIGVGSVRIRTLEGKLVQRSSTKVDWDISQAQKEGYSHFMIKEIMEQPRSLQQTAAGRIQQGKVAFQELQPLRAKLSDPKKMNRMILLGCGTAHHAGLVGGYLLEKLVQVPVEVDMSSEFRYCSPVITPETLVIAVSQSGETADTLAGIRYAKKQGAMVMAICNVVGSSITREVDATLYTHAGPEIAVASTKTYTSQLSMLFLISLYLGSLRKLVPADENERLLQYFKKLPEQVEKVLAQSSNIQELASRYARFDRFLYLGRHVNYPSALEGALKLKEISYIHAEGYPAGEMKHGHIALIDDNMPVMCIVTQSSVYEKMFSNLQEVHAREGKIIAIATQGDSEIRGLIQDGIYLPETHEFLSPIIVAVALQLFAYHVAVHRGLDVDQPRNLAKSVTVE